MGLKIPFKGLKIPLVRGNYSPLPNPPACALYGISTVTLKKR